MENVVFGFLGSKLDAGLSERRLARWRPTVALCAHAHFPVSRLELLLHSEADRLLAERVIGDLSTVSPQTRVRLHVLKDANPWNFEDIFGALHDIARAYPFAENERYYVHLTTGSHVAQICLFLLAESRRIPALLVETAMNREAPDAWRGKLDIIDLDLSVYDRLASRFACEQEESRDVLKNGIVTRNPRFNRLIERIERVALSSRAPLLLMGPTGSGKSQLARRIHALRNRRHLVKGVLVEVNCATLRGDNAMSALFGHRKGAFTGAVADRPGLLKAADGGTLFLDEIGELGLEEQAMLLRALEEKTFRPLGADAETSSNFVLIAGTNCNLNTAVNDGTFRADLLARLNLWSFTLPGLAERREDIEPNLDHELNKQSAELGCRISMSKEARQMFLGFAMRHAWPDNFRGFGASVLRMATLSDGGRITEKDVQEELEHLEVPEPFREVQREPSPLQHVAPGLLDAMDFFDRVQLEAVIEVIATSDTLAQAGRTLYDQSRAQRAVSNDSDRLRKYLSRFGLDFRSLKQKLMSDPGRTYGTHHYR